MAQHDDAHGATGSAGSASAAPHSVTLAGDTDLEGFRRACRTLWAEQVEPARVGWHTADDAEIDLFDGGPAQQTATGDGSPPLQVPAAFMPLCESVILHRDPGRFGLLYRLLWRLQTEPGLRHDPLDADRVQARQMAQEVRREMHRMKELVHFREVRRGPGEAPLHLAWFEPEHHVVAATAPFFASRFAASQWAILTPDKSVGWDGARLLFAPGVRRDQAPPADAGDELWLACHENLFAPARSKLAMMNKEARRPEATRSDPQEAPRSLPALAAALERCRECPIGEHATRAVPGEGPQRARLMFVGEQPGDQEDLQGRPFVGPAGQLLARALAELGVDRREVYITNAVKHFKFELRGKRRIHKTPAEQEAAACLHWLESEIELVDPQALVALGATAARQLLGRPVAVTRARGQWFKRADGRRVLVTLHPSALLRLEPDDKDAAYAAWLADLRHTSSAA
ncbi:MAG: UdgX family uracil-DNA binding protein [Caldimonas sp.]